MEGFGSTAWGSIPLTQEQFIADVKKELSVACAVPVTVRTSEVERIIKYAAKWFYKNYENAVEERLYCIPRTNFDTDRFKRSRTIVVPECVVAVTGVKKLREDFTASTAWEGTGGEITLEKMIFKDVANVGVGIGADDRTMAGLMQAAKVGWEYGSGQIGRAHV